MVIFIERKGEKMKNYIKKMIIMNLILVMIVVLTACTKAKKETIQNNNVNIEQKQFKLYDVINDENIDYNVELNANYTAQDVVDAYIIGYADLSTDSDEEKIEYVKSLPVITAKVKDGYVHLSFSSVLENVGSSVEGNFIDNLVANVITYVKDIKGVYIDVNGEDYKSGHIEILTSTILGKTGGNDDKHL